MILIERNLSEVFGLLIPLIITVSLLVYVSKSRFNLIKSIFFAHFSKAYFRAVENNKEEQEFMILLWSSVFLQGIMIHLYFITSSFPVYLYYLIIVGLIIIKYLIIKFSSKLLEQAMLFNFYITSFFISVIHYGWLCMPVVVLNILYFNRIENGFIQLINSVFLAVGLFYFVYRFIFLVNAANKEKISFLHIFIYLCTLEILPLGVISAILVIN